PMRGGASPFLPPARPTTNPGRPNSPVPGRMSPPHSNGPGSARSTAPGAGGANQPSRPLVDPLPAPSSSPFERAVADAMRRKAQGSSQSTNGQAAISSPGLGRPLPPANRQEPPGGPLVANTPPLVRPMTHKPASSPPPLPGRPQGAGLSAAARPPPPFSGG